MVNTWLGAIILFVVMLLIYGIIGAVAVKLLGLNHSIFLQIVDGYIMTSVLFAAVALPVELAKKSLTFLTILWGIAILILVFVSAAVIRRKKSKFHLDRSWKEMDRYWWIIILLVALSLIFITVNGYYGSWWDNSTYNGIIVTALHTDTIFQYDPYTGLPMIYEKAEYLAVYEIHSAVICRMTGMHGLIFVNRVLAWIELLFYNIICIEVFKRLFLNNIKKVAVAIGFLILFNVFTVSIYGGTPSAFLFFRAAESKSMTANFFIPLIFLIIYDIYRNVEANCNWIILFFLLLAGCSVSNSAIFVMPVAVVSGTLPIAFYKKKWKILYKTIIVLLPNICYIFLYMFWM